jgi:Na+-translocating ferredoxin:NAD+ oxidoreductase RnfC subunit
LIGHELSPHLLVRAVNYQGVATPQTLLSALTCSECNVCESVACPVGISPMRVNRLLKVQCASGARYEGPLREADEMARYRLIPVKRLVAKLGLATGIRMRRWKSSILPLHRSSCRCASILVRQRFPA